MIRQFWLRVLPDVSAGPYLVNSTCELSALISRHGGRAANEEITLEACARLCESRESPAFDESWARASVRVGSQSSVAFAALVGAVGCEHYGHWKGCGKSACELYSSCDSAAARQPTERQPGLTRSSLASRLCSPFWGYPAAVMHPRSRRLVCPRFPCQIGPPAHSRAHARARVHTHARAHARTHAHTLGGYTAAHTRCRVRAGHFGKALTATLSLAAPMGGRRNRLEPQMYPNTHPPTQTHTHAHAHAHARMHCTTIRTGATTLLLFCLEALAPG